MWVNTIPLRNIIVRSLVLIFWFVTLDEIRYHGKICRKILTPIIVHPIPFKTLFIDMWNKNLSDYVPPDNVNLINISLSIGIWRPRCYRFIVVKYRYRNVIHTFCLQLDFTIFTIWLSGLMLTGRGTWKCVVQ